MTKVAVVGGGLCGLATSWHLLKLNCRVVVFDSQIHKGVPRSTNGFYATASAVAAGLLHPLTPKLKVAWAGDAAMADANSLLDDARHYGGEDLVTTNLLLRPCRDEADALKCSGAAALLGSARLRWIEPADFDYGGNGFGGVQIVQGKVIDAARYLRALWAACEASGDATWQNADADVSSLLADYDRVIFCGGARGLGPLLSGRRPGLRLTRGESAELRRRSSLPEQKPWALLRGDYLAPLADKGHFILGATREGIDAYAETAPDDVDTLLRGKLAGVAASLGLNDEDFQGQASTAGVRFDGPRTPFGRLPFVHVDEDEPRLIYAGGLGARGLLRHGQIGALAAAVAMDGAPVPLELRLL